jgi:peptidyl-prolyl cis-trans isomerase C
MKYLLMLVSTVLLAWFAPGVVSQNIIEDNGVGMTQEEVDQIIKRWTPQMQRAAANDAGDRLELLNIALAAKKIANEADNYSRTEDPELYWRYQLAIRGTKQGFVLKDFLDSLAIPDMSELARERYETLKDQFAKVPEQRLSSNILFKCFPGECDRVLLRIEAQRVLDELLAGADFVEYVHKYSGDPGTKAKDGFFDKWMVIGETGVEPRYTGGVFDIANIGDYSGLVESRFGIHLVRLDDIREAHHLPFEDVEAGIIKLLEGEYRKLSAKEFNARFQITDDAYINGDAMDTLFGKFKAAE